MTEDEQEEAAARIDERLRQLEEAGFAGVALLSLMVEQARAHHRLVRGATTARLSELHSRFDGLRKFGQLLAAMALPRQR